MTLVPLFIQLMCFVASLSVVKFFAAAPFAMIVGYSAQDVRSFMHILQMKVVFG
jgi:hypothetical protein